MDDVVLLRMTTSFSSRDSLQSSEISAVNSEPVSGQNVELVGDLLNIVREELRRAEFLEEDEVEPENDPKEDLREMARILQDINFLAMMEAHDLIASQNLAYLPMDSEPQTPILPGCSPNGHQLIYSTTLESSGIRKVGVRWKPGTELGMTVKLEKGQLVVTRILMNSLIEKQGLLEVGDVITHVNDMPVRTVEELQSIMANPGDMVTFEIIPNPTPAPLTTPSFLKALFDYDALTDIQSPCQAIGLSFAKGDILEVMDMSDPNYWQARKLGCTGPARLIPSQNLQERRMAGLYAPGKRKRQSSFSLHTFKRLCTRKTINYSAGGPQALETDQCEISAYEEVMLCPPLPRKVILLLGLETETRRFLVNRLLKDYPDRYGYPIPHTSRLPRPGEEHGRSYYFTTYQEMHKDIAANEYIEYGELNGILYGTRLSSVQAVIRDGRCAVLDCSPQCLKFVRTKEFLPFVVFVHSSDFEKGSTAASSRAGTPNGTLRKIANSTTFENMKIFRPSQDSTTLQNKEEIIFRTYEPYIDLIIKESDPQSAFEVLMQRITKSETEDQWIPVSWIY